jgi:dTDP-4-amino-4,6-dideoxygalactose transaminase
MIPYSKHFIDEDDIDAVNDVLRNKSITQGELVNILEKKISNYVKSKYAVAVTSCSAGLHLSCKVLNIKNKNVVTSPITFASTASSVLHSGGNLNFADISSKNININLDKIKNLNLNIHTVIPIHFSGAAVELKNFRRENPKIKILEDSAHALGSKYKTGDMVGSCKYSDISVFSLHPAKTITSGEGGIITTNNKNYYEKLKLLSNNGVQKIKNNFKLKKNKNQMWYYEVQELGYHYRITDFQCALAISQLKKINEFLKKRKKIVKKYDNAFKNFENLAPAVDILERKSSSNHLYVVRIKYKKIKKSRNTIMNYLKKKKIITQVHYIPITNHPLFKKHNHQSQNLSNAESYYEEALSLPLYYSLKEHEQEKVIKELKKIVG